jgi:large subunit ribosomal protein L21
VYAVIETGGKQERVEEGQRLAVELLGAGAGQDVSFSPILVVDGDSVLATPAELAGAAVSARVLGEEKGNKIRGFTYKPKARRRRRWGHRQRYSTIEVTSITLSRPTKDGAADPEGAARASSSAEA